MFKNWRWSESNQQELLAPDSLAHFICHLLVGRILLEYGMIWYEMMVFMFALGIIWEYIEITSAYDGFCKWWDSKWLNKVCRLGGKADCLSIKDILCNIIGNFTAIIL